MGAVFCSAHTLVISAGYFPYSLENKFAFSKADLSSSNLILTVLISAFSIFLISMVMDLSETTRGCTISLFLTKITKSIISTLHHGHLRFHVWAFFEANESLINCDVFSIDEILVGLRAFLSNHRSIRPYLALNLREYSYAHKVDFKCPSVFNSDLPES